MATEKRLIDANALMKAIKSFRWFGVPNTLRLMFDYIKIIIRDQPTVDAVPVVRCKDCKHYVLQALACRHENINGIIQTDGFCSYGERKDNETD